MDIDINNERDYKALAQGTLLSKVSYKIITLQTVESLLPFVGFHLLRNLIWFLVPKRLTIRKPQ